MSSPNIDKYTVNSQIDIRQAMKILDDSHRKILFVVEDDISFIGTLTDGDIRRWILGGNNLDDTVENICNKDPITYSSDYKIDEIKNTMLDHRIQAIPITVLLSFFFGIQFLTQNDILKSRATWIFLLLLWLAGLVPVSTHLQKYYRSH